MTFYQELLLKVIDGLLIGVLVLLIGFWLNRRLEKLKTKEEYQRQLAQSRINAYLRLWSLMEIFSPSRVGEITYDERVSLSERLRSWYYADGNGLYLSHQAAGAFIRAKDALSNEDITFSEIKELFSRLRTQMKIDAGVYDQEESVVQIVNKDSG